MNHCSTAEQRVEWISELLAHPEQRGLLSERSRQSHITRQTLYRWKAKGEGALHECLQPQPAASKRTPIIERAVLTLPVVFALSVLARWVDEATLETAP